MLEREAAQPDQHTAFMRLFLAHQRRIYGFLLTLVPRESDADDLLQETAAVMWEKFASFEPGTDFGAWALRIARFKAMHFFDRRKRTAGHLSLETMEHLADYLSAVPDRGAAVRDALAGCLGRLSEADRRVIEIRYEQGGSAQEVARRFNRSVFTVHKWLNRIYEQLLGCIRRSMAEAAGE